MTKISVVTAVLNRKAQIGTALQSVRDQSYGDIEHIIQDGVSTDGTLAVVDQYRTDKMDVLSEKDSGIYDAINRGIRRATGDVIGLMHSDDFFASDTVIEQVAAALADPDIDGVYGDLDYVSAENPDKIIRRWRSGSYTPRKLRQGWMPRIPRFTYAALFSTNGGFMIQVTGSLPITMRCCAIWKRAASNWPIFRRSW